MLDNKKAPEGAFFESLKTNKLKVVTTIRISTKRTIYTNS